MIPEFIEKYFIDPIKQGGGYNWVNTLTYAFVLGVIACLAYRYLASRITLSRKAYYSISLFLLVGGCARVLNDMGVSGSYLLVTPLIYFLIFGIALVSLVITIKIWKEEYYKYMAAIALCLFVYILVLLVMNAETFNGRGFLSIVITAAAISALVYYTARVTKFKAITNNIEIMAGHILDASATSFGLAFYGYFEQHMIPGLFIQVFKTPFVMFPLKIAAVGMVLYLIEDIEEEGYKNLFRLVILALGVAPGVRDLLRITLMT